MKKKGILLVILFFVFVIFPFVVADEESQALEAYACVDEKIENISCESLSISEKAFSFLALEKCETSLIDSSSGSCFPEGSCDLKSTSESAIALEMKNQNTSNYSSWIMDRTTIVDSLDWFLQVDTSEKSNCNINNSIDSYSFQIQENKKLNSGGSSSCFSVSSNDYWIEVDSSCYDKNILVSCDENFKTTLLFKKKDSQTINIFDRTKSSLANKTIEEKIKSYCFSNDGSCDYEASLWATLSLDISGKDTSNYLPYLISMKDSNENYFPDSFLYYFTGRDVFLNSISSLQNEEGYFNISGNIYFDTALPLLFLSSNSPERQDAENWILSNQQNNGCFGDSFVNNNLLLFSAWSEYFDVYNSGDDSGNDSDGSDPEIDNCGDGVIDFNEKCDGNNLGGNTCLDVRKNSVGGDLGCNPPGTENECTFNVSECAVEVGCESDDECSGENVCLDGECVNPEDNSSEVTECGNGIIEYNEECDGDDLGGNSCLDVRTDSTGGNLNCNPPGTPNECEFDILECEFETPECDENNSCFLGSECIDGKCVEIGSNESSQGKLDCEDMPGFCMSKSSCFSAGGQVSDSYSCSGGFNFCCDKKEFSCSDEGGTFCSSDEICDGTLEGEGCCTGECVLDSSSSEQSDSCFSNSDCFSGEECNNNGVCVEKTKSKNVWFIWVLLMLIILAILGIVFRNKLKSFWFKMKSKFEKKEGSKKVPKLSRRGLNRRIPPRAPRRPLLNKRKSTRVFPKKKPSEFDDVMRKLKEMGK